MVLDSLQWMPYLLCLTGYLVSSESVDRFSLSDRSRVDEVVNLVYQMGCPEYNQVFQALTKAAMRDRHQLGERSM